MPTTEETRLLVDGHVHFYECYDDDLFFRSAVRNFRAGADELVLDGARGCLLFTETARDHYFRALRETGRTRSGTWSFRTTMDDAALIGSSGNGDGLFVVAGRQLATREGLEVLGLGCDAEFPEGLPLSEAIDAVASCGALPVIPWGFGKWWFGRGRLVASAVQEARRKPLFLGDNSGRARFGPRPRIFRMAADAGIPVLAGTDPLPFADQATKPGRYGFALKGTFDRERPAESLKRLLRGLQGQPRTFGRLERLAAFCRYQIAMQLRKRRIPGAA